MQYKAHIGSGPGETRREATTLSAIDIIKIMHGDELGGACSQVRSLFKYETSALSRLNLFLWSFQPLCYRYDAVVPRIGCFGSPGARTCRARRIAFCASRMVCCWKGPCEYFDEIACCTVCLPGDRAIQRADQNLQGNTKISIAWRLNSRPSPVPARLSTGSTLTQASNGPCLAPQTRAQAR